MESNKLDTLFREKLERHQEPVSADAWSQVQSQLKAKKQPLAYRWYVAASVTLLTFCTLAYFLLQSNAQENTYAVQPLNIENTTMAFQEETLKQELTIPSPTLESEKKIIKQDRPTSVPQSNTLKQERIASVNEEVSLKIEGNILPKIATRPAGLSIDYASNTKTASFEKVNNNIVVEMNFNPPQLNEIEKGKNKFKSLASELSIADIRAAKNELFASALSFDKKRLN